MTASRRSVVVGGVLAAAVTATLVVGLTPWQPLPGSADIQPQVAADFTPAEVARAAAFRSDLGPWPYASLALALAVPWLLLLVVLATGRVPDRPVARGAAGTAVTVLTVVASVLGVLLAQLLLTLPLDVHAEVVLRRYGLSTQTWAGWARDAAVGLLLSAAVTSTVVLAVVGVVRRAPRRWPWLLAAGAAAFAVLGSAVYPLVVERAYNRFTPLPPGPLTERIESVARRSGFHDVRVVVSDASIRTTGENAHVSGLGSTRWVVLDDTLVARARTDPDAVVAVVAHEFGHVVHDDVARGTAVAACGSVALVLLLAGAATGARGRRFLPDPAAGPRTLVRTAVLIVAVTTTAPVLAAPVTNLVSRRVEARADVSALEATGDPAAFIRMQHALATTNLSRLEPAWWQTVLFASHPSPPWRIALARAWQASRSGPPARPGPPG